MTATTSGRNLLDYPDMQREPTLVPAVPAFANNPFVVAQALSLDDGRNGYEMSRTPADGSTQQIFHYNHREKPAKIGAFKTVFDDSVFGEGVSASAREFGTEPDTVHSYGARSGNTGFRK